MNLKEQTYICTLARCGTITKAAEELFITAPALSMFLSNLEKNMGVRLFSRTGKTLEPTSIGREYIHCAGQMLLLKEEFDRKLARETGVQQRTVRIAIQQLRATSALPWLISNLQEKLPDIHVVFQDGDYSELVELFERHQVNYLFYTLIESLPGTEHVVLKREPILVAVPRDHPCTRRAKCVPGLEYPCLELSELDGETMILPQKNQSLRIDVDRLLSASGLRPGQVIEIKAFATIMEMVSKGTGIGFNRLAYLEGMKQMENVRYYFLGNPPECASLVLMYPRAQKNALYHDTIVRVFEEYMRNH